jgi:hypothetical protein
MTLLSILTVFGLAGASQVDRGDVMQSVVDNVRPDVQRLMLANHLKAIIDVEVVQKLKLFRRSALFTTFEALVEEFLATPDGRSVLASLPKVISFNSLLVQDPLPQSPVVVAKWLDFLEDRLTSQFGVLHLPASFLNEMDQYRHLPNIRMEPLLPQLEVLMWSVCTMFSMQMLNRSAVVY